MREGETVEQDRNGRRRATVRGSAVNDNGNAEARVAAVVLVVARLIGRRIAREDFDGRNAANDNAPARNTGERREN